MTRKNGRRASRLEALPSVEDDDQTVRVVIETPKGRRTKLAYDPELGVFVVKKVLPQGMSFPFDFGFVPSTIGQDDDPLDVLVLMDEPVPTGTVVPARLIGVIEAEQTEQDGMPERNDRLIAVSQACALSADVKKLSDLPQSVTSEIERFFVSYNEQAGKVFTPLGRHGRKRAEAALESGRRKFAQRPPQRTAKKK